MQGRKVDELKRAIELFPTLSKFLRKGECGRIGVIGGAPEYTGAPYFAAMSSMKLGADLSYLFSHPDASGPIKSYSPELIVYPTLDPKKIDPSHFNAIVFGPGIGREKERLVPLLKNMLNRVAALPDVVMVIDADGVFLLGSCLAEAKKCKNVIVTPNHREFERLFNTAFPEESTSTETELERTKKLASRLGICVLRKGEEDIITNGDEVRVGKVPGALRRCGGQGDIMAGVAAVLIYWARLKDSAEAYKTKHILDGAEAASDFVRFTAHKTFENIGRSMGPIDIINEIPSVVRQVDEVKGFGY